VVFLRFGSAGGWRDVVGVGFPQDGAVSDLLGLLRRCALRPRAFVVEGWGRLTGSQRKEQNGNRTK